jgi:fibronectin type 3 domain-containing protein
MKPCLKPSWGGAVVCVLLIAGVALGIRPAAAFPVITNVVETGGDNDPDDTVPAKWTGVTWSNHQANEPIPGLPAGQPYTVGLFRVCAPAYVDRNHAYTNAAGTVPMPPYLVGQEYIMCGNDNRDNAGYRLDVYVATAVDVYLLIDNRLYDGVSADPPTFGPTSMQWVLDEGWQPVLNGINRNGDPNVPDEVGIDESADGTINQWFSVYKKSFPAGSFQLKQADNAGRNMYGVVVVSVTPPPAPSNLQAVSGDGRVILSWTPVGGISGYYVKRALVRGGPYTTIATVTAAAYTDTDVVNGITYYYVVSAFNIAGESPNSDEVIGQPRAAPRNVVAVGGTNQVVLSWDALAGAESYTVKRSATSGGPYEPVATGITATTYTDAPLASGRYYYYVVVGQLAGGLDSGQSDEAAALTAPSAPTISVTRFAATVLRVGWTGTDPVISDFLIERSTDGQSFERVAAVPGRWGGYTNDGLALDTTWFYRVQAQNATGPSDYSNVASNTTPSWGVNVNFANGPNSSQNPNPAPTPPGYLQDVGELFGDRGNGYVYGWYTPAGTNITPDARWRQSAASPDLRYDTLNHMQKGVGAGVPNAYWEIEIPDGFYLVRVVAGDPAAVDSVFQFNIEGVVTETYTPASGAWWGEFTVACAVNDSRLTVDSGPSASNNKINFIDIYAFVPEPIVIATHPQSQKVAVNRPVQFSVGVSAGTRPIFYQWLFNGVEIPDATNATYLIPRVQFSDAGQYAVVLRNYAGSVTSAPAALVVYEDYDPPRLVSAVRAACDIDKLTVVFDELVDPGTAQDFISYTIVNVSEGTGQSARFDLPPVLGPDGKTVTIWSVDPITNGAVYKVEADMTDLAGNFAKSEVLVTLVGAFEPYGPQNLIVLEAENYDAMVPRLWEGVLRYWEFVTNRVGYSGTGAMRALPNTEGNRPGFPSDCTSLDFCVYFPAPGTYYLWVRGAAESGADNSCHGGLDGGIPPSANNLQPGFIVGASGWSWNGVINDNTRSYLDVPSAGLHTVHIYMREDGFYCDKILLTTDPNYNPALVNDGLGPAESSRQVTTPPLKLSIVLDGAGVVVSWDVPGAVLQQADEVTGPWTDVPGASSPYRVQPTAPQKFYRLVLR